MSKLRFAAKRWTEVNIVKAFGHASTCRCIRWVRGRYLKLPVACTCGSGGMTRDKAYRQACSELGEMTAENHAEIVRRIKEIERHGE
jgi:hypothetical protein